MISGARDIGIGGGVTGGIVNGRRRQKLGSEYSSFLVRGRDGCLYIVQDLSLSEKVYRRKFVFWE